MPEKMRDGIIQRGKTWSYVVRERDVQTGKTKPRWVGGFPTRAAAKKARDEARHAVNRGTYVAPQALTVGEYLDRWVDAHAVELKPSTAKSYRDNIGRYLKPAIGHERLQSLSPSRLSVVFKDLYESGGKDGKPLSPRTVEFARAVLRRAMQDAVLDRALEVNPVVGTKRPKVVKPKHTTWTGPQLRAFLEQVDEDDRWAPLWTLAAATGMRRGELLALRWSEVDLDAGVIHVERSVTQVAQERVYVTPKNHERRDVTVDERTVTTLREWRKAQMAEQLAWGAAYRGAEGLVFTWEDGRAALPDYVTRTFGRITDGLAVPRLRLHELRHTHATMLLRDGVPVHVVAKRLGHKDPSVTLNVYADAIPDDDGRAVETFAKAVWGA
ncbi:tyrosine-type recombinase/integrase [Knoellia koreensis]|uniref:Tyrosine-type recombinase/integrase n=1 Tax=Knoellia koreensis TaxID=2730921 RepID=A0A849HB59_9MICO|nr:tyrosine-type recombinase/integrase [Knoellia sp. DB2414S]NNM44582.1 tyrosine-type recombinase/integrase [Knoellia sp. DB2414S]